MSDVPCPLCGRTDGKHDPTPEEAKKMREMRRRAFWRGFRSGLTLRFWRRPR